MPKTKKTDLEVVRALLGLPLEKLTASERSAFQEMYDKLATGHILNLSMKQRAWVNTAYDKHDLDKERMAPRPVTIKDRSLIGKDLLGPVKGLTPPGRKPQS